MQLLQSVTGVARVEPDAVGGKQRASHAQISSPDDKESAAELRSLRDLVDSLQKELNDKTSFINGQKQAVEFELHDALRDRC